MSKHVLSFKVPQIKSRVHYILFAEDSPFKPKSVKRKDAYQRRPKHKNAPENIG